VCLCLCVCVCVCVDVTEKGSFLPEGFIRVVDSILFDSARVLVLVLVSVSSVLVLTMNQSTTPKELKTLTVLEFPSGRGQNNPH